jgi:hypothetical protein
MTWFATLYFEKSEFDSGESVNIEDFRQIC